MSEFEVDVEAIQRARDAFAAGDWAGCFKQLDDFLRDKRRCGEDQWNDWAERQVQHRMRWYRNRLRNEIFESWKAGEFSSRSNMENALEQRAQSMMSHENVAMLYLVCSGNRDACVTSLDGVPTGGSVVHWTVVASEALMEDVREDLFDDHIMGDTEPLQVRNGWCDGCERWRPEREGYPLGEYVCDECSAP